MQDLLKQMAARILRHANGTRMETALPRVGIGVLRRPSAPARTVCGSGFCLVLQGAKRMLVGDRSLRYAAGTCFASLVALPATRSTIELSDGLYIATSLTLDHSAFHELLTEFPSKPALQRLPAFGVTRVSEELLEAWDRYLALLDKPDDIPILAASRERELLYRLIQSGHGPMIRQMSRDDGQLSQIRRALEWLRGHFEQPFSMEGLAEIAGMSVPSFHRNFRAVTAMSPLQYQKTLRLQAARRLLATDADASRAAYEVGYVSPSQFSREYSRLFGLPPKRDAEQLRKSADGAASLQDGLA